MQNSRSYISVCCCTRLGWGCPLLIDLKAGLAARWIRFIIIPSQNILHYIPWIMHMFERVTFRCGLVMVDVTHILQGCFTGIGAILWLPQCQVRNPEEYGHITHITLLPKWMIQPQQNKTKQCAYLMGCAVYVFCKDLCHVVIHHKLVCRPGFLLGALMTMGWINGYKWTVSNAVDFVTQLNKQGRLNPTMFISYSRKDYTDRIGIISFHIHLKYKGWVQSSYQSCTRKLSNYNAYNNI